ncbi:hypothetical protein AVEN_151170-1 [Araneus ventricosus]|uniref:Protein ZBED8 n=1 Tax=Araneus ventricosus TaxID=182803 RepID=A0A4Y2MTT6_ARAVE|nr:hypothetical protein AVEN_151170-1 [Araneus ventricosus]
MTMKPSKLEDHLRRCHPEKIGKDLKYFQTLKGKYEKRPTVNSMFASTSQSNDDGLRASYNISLLIAKSGKPHTIGEELILPAIEEESLGTSDINDEFWTAHRWKISSQNFIFTVYCQSSSTQYILAPCHSETRSIF